MNDFFREIPKKELQLGQNQEMFMEIDGKWLVIIEVEVILLICNWWIIKKAIVTYCRKNVSR